MDRHEPRAAIPRLHLAVATAGGLGFVPWAPGTAGAALGLLLAVGLATAGGWPALLGGTLAVAAAGWWSAGAAARHLGRHDPGCIVIDEVAGQMTTLLFLPGPLVAGGIVGFLLFRALDVLKPFPARRLEDLPGASGIMADDLVAGLYANLVTQIALRLAPGWLGTT